MKSVAIYKSIPVSRCRIRLFDNRKTKYSLAKMWQLYGGSNVTIMNGPFFNMQTRNPLTHTKIGGNVLYKPKYGEFGIHWVKDGQPEWGVLPLTGADSYFTNTVVIPNGQKRANLSSHVDADGTKAKPRLTSRPAFGFDKKGNFVFGVERSIGLWAFQDLLYKKGWQWALVGDGGASTAFKDSMQTIKPARTIAIYVIITELASTESDEPKGVKPMITIHSYSLKKHGEERLSQNFKVKEFACRDGSDTIFVAPTLVKLLQEARDYFKKPIIISSGYRTETYNAKVGGAAYSQHKYGTAADVKIAGVAPKTVYAWFDKKLGNSGGVGLYTTFTHVDVREVKARWSET